MLEIILTTCVSDFYLQYAKSPTLAAPVQWQLLVRSQHQLHLPLHWCQHTTSLGCHSKPDMLQTGCRYLGAPKTLLRLCYFLTKMTTNSKRPLSAEQFFQFYDIFSSNRSSRNAYLCPSVCAIKSCLELSIFISLALSSLLEHSR